MNTGAGKVPLRNELREKSDSDLTTMKSENGRRKFFSRKDGGSDYKKIAAYLYAAIPNI